MKFKRPILMQCSGAGGLATVDLVIANGHVVAGSGIERVDIVVDEGKVVARLPVADSIDARKRISADGMLVMPGLVDAHVHFREPGAVHKEGFERGTMAAAMGGVTSVMVMPTDNPLTLTVDDYEEKIKLAQGRCYADFAILAQLGPDFSALDPLARLGVLSFEVFLAGQPSAGKIADNALLLSALEKIADHDVVAGITPGDDEIVKTRAQALQAAGLKHPRAFAASRPPIAEAFGVARACLAADETQARVHVRQVSCAISVELLQFWKSRCPKISAEVMPHNLLLSEDDLTRQGCFAKMGPPLRGLSDMECLWRGLHSGVIDMIATDHAPHLPNEKRKGLDDIWLAPLGVPGLQTCLPLLLGEASKGRLSYEKIALLAAEAPARTFGIYPRKGALLPGSDADLVIVDPNRPFTIRNEDQVSRAEVTPFHGWTGRGTPVLTMLRGQATMDSGRITGTPRGALIARKEA
jgi:dihydroorotase (multifunctional complex type)